MHRLAVLAARVKDRGRAYGAAVFRFAGDHPIVTGGAVVGASSVSAWASGGSGDSTGITVPTGWDMQSLFTMVMTAVQPIVFAAIGIGAIVLGVIIVKRLVFRGAVKIAR